MPAVYQISDFRQTTRVVEGRVVKFERPGSHSRGVGWVLKWVSAIAVLCATTIMLLDFACRLAAEQAVVRAAAAGLRES
ncbi:MAG TPA: hypothetical protein VGM76_13830, partial [Lacipirellulaceae bacterium]